MPQLALTGFVCRKDIADFVVGALVRGFEVIERRGCYDVCVLGAEEVCPVEGVVVRGEGERFGGVASGVVAFSAAGVGEDGVCEGDFLEFRVCGGAGGGWGFVWWGLSE